MWPHLIYMSSYAETLNIFNKKFRGRMYTCTMLHMHEDLKKTSADVNMSGHVTLSNFSKCLEVQDHCYPFQLQPVTFFDVFFSPLIFASLIEFLSRP